MNDPVKTAVFKAIDEALKPQNTAGGAVILKQEDFKFRDLCDSSIKLVEFCMLVEENLGIEIEFSDLLDNPTYLRFTAWLSQQQASA